jgi:two-component system nitrogen regulation response regulator GlnG
MLAEETLAELERRPWYGNVRELRKAVEHALVIARSGIVIPSHLPPPLPQLRGEAVGQEDTENARLARAAEQLASRLLDNSALNGAIYDEFLQNVEPTLLTAAMHRSGNQCAAAARALGIHRTTLKRKLDHYGLSESPAASQADP